MKQIYNFEQMQPPVLNESRIRAEMEKRKLRLQTTLLAAAAILLLITVILLGHLVYESYPWIALFCFTYTVVSATGGGVIAVVFTRKGGFFV